MCHYCHKPFALGMPGMEPRAITFCKDEQFILHEHCADEIADKAASLTEKKRQKYYKNILKKISDS